MQAIILHNDIMKTIDAENLMIFSYYLDDHTRVCLSNLGDNGSDYINANYIDVCID
jgi:protein tyrosine phosphatase